MGGANATLFWAQNMQYWQVAEVGVTGFSESGFYNLWGTPMKME